jgi:hypothetical protein
MRIFDPEADAQIWNVTVYLTKSELLEMLGLIEGLAADTEQHHIHLTDKDYKREITIAVYHDRNLESFDDRSRQLILSDD